MKDNEKSKGLSPEQKKFEDQVCLYRGLSRMLAEKRISREYWPQFPESQIEDLRDQAWLELVDAMPFDAVLDIEDQLDELKITVQP